ncbi:MAG: septum formation initiator family protein [Actinobacteria bacterium]|nr:septum formation initiator family protein [Actinomycetota bacterium]
MRDTEHMTSKTASRSARTAPERTAVGLLSTSIALRQAVVWAILLIATLQFAGPVQALVAQQRQASALEAEVAQRKAALAELKQRKQRLSDPHYVKALARARLHFVMPGETAYIVVDAQPEKSADLPWDSAVVAAAAQQPWWVTMHHTMAQSSAEVKP